MHQPVTLASTAVNAAKHHLLRRALNDEARRRTTWSPFSREIWVDAWSRASELVGLIERQLGFLWSD